MFTYLHSFFFNGRFQQTNILFYLKEIQKGDSNVNKVKFKVFSSLFCE